MARFAIYAVLLILRVRCYGLRVPGVIKPIGKRWECEKLAGEKGENSHAADNSNEPEGGDVESRNIEAQRMEITAEDLARHGP